MQIYCGFHMGFQANIVCPKAGSDGKDVGLYMTLYQRKGLKPGETPQERGVTFVSVYKGDVENDTEVR